jgi:hypothetical protein
MTNVIVIGWGMLIVGLILLVGSAVKRINDSRKALKPEVENVKVKKILPEGYRVLYWRIREAMPGHIVLCQVPFHLSVHLGTISPKLAVETRELIFPILICGSDSLPIVGVYLAATEKEILERQFSEKSLLESIGIQVLTFDHPYIPVQQLVTVVKAIERKVLVGTGSERPQSNATNVRRPVASSQKVNAAVRVKTS